MNSPRSSKPSPSKSSTTTDARVSADSNFSSAKNRLTSDYSSVEPVEIALNDMPKARKSHIAIFVAVMTANFLASRFTVGS